ncbi:MAG TPA: DMT family transporter [Candidatus Bathyarchaeia archaeon]|nr:DMT family transporter [Candidatus Bathyarchaeia archaeon]
MNTENFIYLLLIFILWGTWGFFSKIATNRLGGFQTMFWDSLGFILAFIFFLLLSLKKLLPLKTNLPEIFLAALGGVFGMLGYIFFYLLLSKNEASIVVPLTALYPALTIFLAVLFLKEALSITHLAGIILALLSIFLLTK